MAAVFSILVLCEGRLKLLARLRYSMCVHRSLHGGVSLTAAIGLRRLLHLVLGIGVVILDRIVRLLKAGTMEGNSRLASHPDTLRFVESEIAANSVSRSVVRRDARACIVLAN